MHLNAQKGSRIGLTWKEFQMHIDIPHLLNTHLISKSDTVAHPSTAVGERPSEN